MPVTPSAPVGELSYEQARDELVAVVAELEQGAETLERSLDLWERGEALARRCEEWLIGARARLDAARSGAAAPGAITVTDDVTNSDDATNPGDVTTIDERA